MSYPLTCPLTLCPFVNPVIDPEGNTYEKSAIVAWLSRHGTSPITRTPLIVQQLAPNRAIIDLLTMDAQNQTRSQGQGFEMEEEDDEEELLRRLHRVQEAKRRKLQSRPSKEHSEEDEVIFVREFSQNEEKTKKEEEDRKQLEKVQGQTGPGIQGVHGPSGPIKLKPKLSKF